jgi:bifunctional non-homologous end joining protein LigD
MLPTPAKAVPVGPDWLHEAKLDGFRAQIHVEDGEAILYSRNGADLTKRFRSIRTITKDGDTRRRFSATTRQSTALPLRA